MVRAVALQLRSEMQGLRADKISTNIFARRKKQILTSVIEIQKENWGLPRIFQR